MEKIYDILFDVINGIKTMYDALKINPGLIIGGLSTIGAAVLSILKKK